MRNLRLVAEEAKEDFVGKVRIKTALEVKSCLELQKSNRKNEETSKEK